MSPFDAPGFLRRRLLPLLCLLAATVHGQEPVDILFLIDGSFSIDRSDQEDFRKDAIRAFLDFTQDEGGGQVGLFQFAGWNETTDERLRLIPFNEVPTEPRLRDALLDSWKDAIENELEPFGYATDFNVCLGRGLKAVMEQRRASGRTNKLWVILFTDGKMDVEEDGSAAQRYLDRARDEYGRASLENCNEAAKLILEEEVFPLLEDESVFLTPIWLRWSDQEQSNPFLEKIAKAAKNAPLLTVDKQSLRNVFLKAFDDLPPEITRGWISRGLGYQAQNISGGGQLEVPFRIYQGAKLTKLVTQATTRDYEVDVLDASGTSIVRDVAVRGAGMLYRVIDIQGRAPGAYTLVLKNRSGSAAGFESIVYYRFAFETALRRNHPERPAHPGDTVSFSLEVRADGEPLSDPDLLAGMEAQLLFAGPDGEQPRAERFGGSTLTIPWVIPRSGATGPHALTATVTALKDRTGRWVYSSEPLTEPFTVLPLVRYGMAAGEGFLGTTVRVELEATKGALPPLGEVTVATPDGEQSVALQTVGKLAYADVPLTEAGEYTVREPSGAAVFAPNAHPTLVARQRGLRVVAAPGGEALEELGVPLEHRTEQESGVDFFIEVEMFAGEQVKLYTGHEDTAAALELAISPDSTALVADTPVPAKLAVKVTSSDRLPDDLATLVLRVEVVQGRPERLDVPVVYQGERPSWLMENLWWILPLLILLLLLLLWWLLRPQWERQQLVAVRSGFLARDGVLMIDHKYGLRGNKARGLPEVPEGVRFVQGGIGKSHGKTKLVLPKGVGCKVEGQPVSGKKLLKHGDLLNFGSFQCRFFEQDPTQDERDRFEDDEFVLDDEDDIPVSTGSEIDDDEEFVLEDDDDI